MLFSPPLQRATLIQRYKRFLADVITPDGTTLTLHCPNTGAMTGCATPGDTVWYSTSENTKRKYPHTWELTETQSGAFICVNTLRANQLTKEAIQENRLPALAGYNILKSEVKYGAERSRIDFMLQADFRPDCYIEVKSVTLAEKENGYFSRRHHRTRAKTSSGIDGRCGGRSSRSGGVRGAALRHYTFFPRTSYRYKIRAAIERGSE